MKSNFYMVRCISRILRGRTTFYTEVLRHFFSPEISKSNVHMGENSSRKLSITKGRKRTVDRKNDTLYTRKVYLHLSRTSLAQAHLLCLTRSHHPDVLLPGTFQILHGSLSGPIDFSLLSSGLSESSSESLWLGQTGLLLCGGLAVDSLVFLVVFLIVFLGRGL